MISKTVRSALDGSVSISGSIYKGIIDTSKVTRFYRLEGGPIGELDIISAELDGKKCTLGENSYIEIKNDQIGKSRFFLHNRRLQLTILPKEQNNYLYVYKNTGSSRQGNLFGVFIDKVSIDEDTELNYWSLGKPLQSCMDKI